jgi:hypothetical protein
MKRTTHVEARTTKRCTQCEKRKPLDEFNRRAASCDGRRAECRSCQALENEACWRRLGYASRTDYEKANAKRAGYASLTDYGKANVKRAGYASLTDYRKANAKRAGYASLTDYMKANAERAGYASLTDYRKATPSVIAAGGLSAIARRRQMLKLRAQPAWVNGECNLIYAERDALPGGSVAFKVDHFWPLQPRKIKFKGRLVRPFTGLHVPWNLRIIPFAENAAKTNHRPDVYYSKREFRRIERELGRGNK